MSSIAKSSRVALEVDAEESEDFYFESTPAFQLPDDALLDSVLHSHIASLVESMTRIGGEVCRLRAEVDGLFEQNVTLIESFQKLKEVISEKGSLNLDDFELACEVMQSINSGEGVAEAPAKKFAH